MNFSSLCALFRLLSWIYGCHQKEGKFWQRIYVNKKCKQTSYTKLIDINNKPQEDRHFDSDATFVRQNLDSFLFDNLTDFKQYYGVKMLDIKRYIGTWHVQDFPVKAFLSGAYLAS